MFTAALFNVDGESAVIGSAFFAIRHGRIWLFTAAHVPQCKPKPRSNWRDWPASMTARLASKGPDTRLPLFDDSGERRPLFACLEMEGRDQLTDMIALPLDGENFVSGSPLVGASVMDLDSAPDPVTGSALTVMGFPRADKWPVFPPSVLEVRVVSCANGLVEYEPIATAGYSGGPLIDDAGRLAGLVMGHNGHGRAASPNALRLLVDRSAM